MVQWLRLCIPNAGGLGSIPGQGTRRHKVQVKAAQSRLTLCDPMDYSLSMGILQARILDWVAMPSSRGIFPTQGSNPGLPHCRQILYHLSHQGSPWILEWVAYPFSRGSSQHRNWTEISCIAGRFFTSWVISIHIGIQILYSYILAMWPWANMRPLKQKTCFPRRFMFPNPSDEVCFSLYQWC